MAAEQDTPIAEQVWNLGVTHIKMHANGVALRELHMCAALAASVRTMIANRNTESDELAGALADELATRLFTVWLVASAVEPTGEA